MPSRFEDFPALPDSSVTLWLEEATRYPEGLAPSKAALVATRHPSQKPDIARWAPELRGHDAPMVSRDGRGELD